jgi:hypothetical protein
MGISFITSGKVSVSNLTVDTSLTKLFLEYFLGYLWQPVCLLAGSALGIAAVTPQILRAFRE